MHGRTTENRATAALLLDNVVNGPAVDETEVDGTDVVSDENAA